MKLVLDCSAALAMCLPDERSVLSEILAPDIANAVLIAPSIWPLEVANALRIAHTGGRITTAELPGIFRGLALLGVELDTALPDVQASYKRAKVYGLTAYDAAYLGLAQSQNAELITFDKKLRSAAGSVGVVVLPR